MASPNLVDKHMCRERQSSVNDTASNAFMPNVPHTKRTRPCDACRRRKSKCVTEDGSAICVLCKFHQQECTYLHAAESRKRPVDGERVLDRVSPRKRHTARNGDARPAQTEEYDDLPGPSLLKRTLGLQNLHHSRYIGPNDVLHTYGSGFRPGSDSNPRGCAGSIAETGTVRFVHPSHAFRIIPDVATAGHDDERASADEVEATVEGHGPELVRLYFRIVHPSFPVLHKAVWLEKYARSHREFTPASLAAVYLLASGYWAYSEKLTGQPKPDLAKLQRLAFASLQHALKRPKLSTLQAGLLLAQYQGSGGQDLYRGLTAELVNLSYGLGLHLDASEWDIPAWEISLRRRLAWAMFMQDKWTALLEGHPSLLSHDDWEVQRLSETDFPENTEDDEEGSSEVEKGRLVFVNMATLAELLAEILTDVFSARARRALDASPIPFAFLLERVKGPQIKLKSWFASLPAAVKMDTAASMKLSSVGYLRLAYLTVEVCIHRQLVKVLPDPETLARITPVYRAAAQERFDNAVDFAQRLQAQHLASFWYFGSARSCALIYSFGQALEASSQNEEERKYFAKKLREYKWALKVDGEAGAVFMKTALGLIEHSGKVTTISAATFDTASPTQHTSASYTTTSPSMDPSPASLDPFNGLHEKLRGHQGPHEVNSWSFDDTWDFNGTGQWFDPSPGNAHPHSGEG